MEAKAVAKTIRIQPRKARLVIDLIRGKAVEEAQAILKGTTNKGAPIIEKVLNSAIANAINNNEMVKENLYVKEAYVDEGRTLKRRRAGSRGNVDPILKRTSHITVVLSDGS